MDKKPSLDELTRTIRLIDVFYDGFEDILKDRRARKRFVERNGKEYWINAFQGFIDRISPYETEAPSIKVYSAKMKELIDHLQND